MSQAKTQDPAVIYAQVIEKGQKISEQLNDLGHQTDPVTLSALLEIVARALASHGLKKQEFMGMAKDSWRRAVIEKQLQEQEKRQHV